jgi:hypothetical protein
VFEGKEGNFLFLTNFKHKGLGYKTVLQTVEQEAGFFGGGKVGVANGFEPTPLQIYKKGSKAHVTKHAKLAASSEFCPHP